MNLLAIGRTTWPNWRKRKTALGLGALALILLVVFGPPAYRESWLDPLTTLNMPNRQLHPYAFDKIGLRNPTDPFHPKYSDDRALVQELLHNLRYAAPLASATPLADLNRDDALYLTLHRDASLYHTAADLSLCYYPANNILLFADAQFRPNQATELLLRELPSKMRSGWW